MAMGTGMLQKAIRAWVLSLEELGYYGDTELSYSISCGLRIKVNLWGNLKKMNIFPYIDKWPVRPLM